MICEAIMVLIHTSIIIKENKHKETWTVCDIKGDWH